MKEYLKRAEKPYTLKLSLKNDTSIKLTAKGLANIMKSISKGGPCGGPCGIAQGGPTGEKMFIVTNRKIYGKQINKAGRTIKTKKY